MGRQTQQSGSKGFTLIEIMLVVAIIGLLAVLAIPAFAKARRNSRISAQKNDLRILADAFELYAMEQGNFPAATWFPGVLPPGMSTYIKMKIWTRTAPCGGNYAWKQNVTVPGVVRYYISLSGNVDQSLWDEMDQEMDDGNPATGKMRSGGVDHAYFVDQ